MWNQQEWIHKETENLEAGLLDDEILLNLEENLFVKDNTMNREAAVLDLFELGHQQVLGAGLLGQTFRVGLELLWNDLCSSMQEEDEMKKVLADLS